MTETYLFGPYELRVDTQELHRAGAIIELEPRPLEVLAELLRHPGELVTKTELMDVVWAGRVVTESALARSVSKLRSALDEPTQRLIVNVHGYGYRYAGEVTRVEAAADANRDRADAPPAAPRAGDRPPLRPHWRLVRALDARSSVWLAENDKTGEKRVYKFALSAAEAVDLRREIAIHRLLKRALGERADIATMIDFNLTTPPPFIETAYCDLGNLEAWCRSEGGLESIPIERRLALIADAADALSTAHALGVLHMDVKPANLLVIRDHDGTVRLRWTDFGSARLLEPARLEAFGITRAGLTQALGHDGTSLRGTPLYLAPEVLRGEPPTIRSDLYALGVLLYQMVARDFRIPLAAGWERNVADELLREDIAAAANDDPARRFGSADVLAARLRTLEQRRVALERERGERLEAQRNRERVARARARRPWLAGIAALVLASIAVGAWTLRETQRARDTARREAAVAHAVIGFLDHDILATGSPFAVSTSGAEHVTVRQAVDRAAAHVDARFRGRPAVAASILATIGQVYVEDGDYAAAEREIGKAIALSRASRAPTDVTVIRAEYRLAFALSVDQKFAAARQLLDTADAQLAARGSVDPRTALIHDVMEGNYYFARQDYRPARAFFRRSLAEAAALEPRNVSVIAIRQTSLAWCDAALDDFGHAFPLYRAALAEVRHAEPHGGTLTGTIEERYGIGLFLAGHDADARAMLTRAHTDLYATIGNDGLTAEALTFLGWLELRDGQAADAARTLAIAYRQEVASAGPEHRMTLRARACLGMAEIATGDAVTGLADLGAAAAAYRRVLGPNAPESEYFQLKDIEASERAGQPDAGASAAVAKLAPATLAEAAPWEDWAAHLAADERSIGTCGATEDLAARNGLASSSCIKRP